MIDKQFVEEAVWFVILLVAVTASCLGGYQRGYTKGRSDGMQYATDLLAPGVHRIAEQAKELSGE